MKVFTQTFGVVGAIIEKDGKFLLIQEDSKRKIFDGNMWNQPAGWIDVGENPNEAVVREVKEETGLDFTPTGILGIYSVYRKDLLDRINPAPHAIKIIYVGDIKGKLISGNEEIKNLRWFSPREIADFDKKDLRDLDIKKEVADYLAGKFYPLDLLTHTISERKQKHENDFG